MSCSRANQTFESQRATERIPMSLYLCQKTIARAQFGTAVFGDPAPAVPRRLLRRSGLQRLARLACFAGHRLGGIDGADLGAQVIDARYRVPVQADQSYAKKRVRLVRLVRATERPKAVWRGQTSYRPPTRAGPTCIKMLKRNVSYSLAVDLCTSNRAAQPSKPSPLSRRRADAVRQSLIVAHEWLAMLATSVVAPWQLRPSA